MIQKREDALHEWLRIQIKQNTFTLKPLAGDASFRRYLRLSYDNVTKIVMDAPPEKENIEPFIKVNQTLQSQGVRTPTIHAADITQGFLILEDFGDHLLLNTRNTKNQDSLYQCAIDTLIQIQQCSTASLPTFNKTHMLNEMALFQEWFLDAYIELPITSTEKQLINATLMMIAERIENQPQVFIHRDYHSRNLMVLGDQFPFKLGVIDFQDAMHGPITYDLVSLIKDCYFKLSKTAYDQYLTFYHQQQPLIQEWTQATLAKEVDICGLQRHLKVLGIFCRLYLRDHKPNYLHDLPLVMDYTMSCLKKYAEFKPFLQFMEKRVLPQFMETSHV